MKDDILKDLRYTDRLPARIIEAEQGLQAVKQCVSRAGDEIERLRDAVRWALGETDEFPLRQSGQGAFWWRTELRKRSGLIYTPPTT